MNGYFKDHEKHTMMDFQRSTLCTTFGINATVNKVNDSFLQEWSADTVALSEWSSQSFQNKGFTHQSITHHSSFMLFWRMVPVRPMRTLHFRAFMTSVTRAVGFLIRCASSTTTAAHSRLQRGTGQESDQTASLSRSIQGLESFTEGAEGVEGSGGFSNLG